MLELIVVSLVRNHYTLCLGIFYRPPSTPYYIFDTLCEALLPINWQSCSNFI